MADSGGTDEDETRTCCASVPPSDGHTDRIEAGFWKRGDSFSVRACGEASPADQRVHIVGCTARDGGIPKSRWCRTVSEVWLPRS